MKKTYKYRLYPSNEQVILLDDILNSCKNLYNTQLEYERYVYQKDKRFANLIELNSLLPDLKVINPSLKKIHSQVLQNVNNRVVKSFKGFFNRIQKCQKAGYPRFKDKHRYDSFTYPQSGFKLTSQNRLKLIKIGEISIKLHRLIKGKVKTLTIKLTPTNKWFACFCVQQDISPIKRSLNKVVGIDLGLENFATLSNGTVIDNPCWLKKSLELLKRRSRQLSKKKRGSSNRSKARLRLTKLYEKICNKRLDFLHKLTHRLVNEYDCIALEDLKPSEMKNKYLQFSINDVSWNKFKQLLAYKAEEAGCELDFVEPRNTTKKCSKCSNIMDMPLHKREYNCSFCGNSMPRDFNSSLNILYYSLFHRHRVGHTRINACGDDGLPSSLKQEAHTL